MLNTIIVLRVAGFAKHLIIVVSAILMGQVALLAQPVPAPEQNKSILLVGGIAHLGNGDKIEQSAIGFSNGVINYVGSASKADQKAYDEVIDASGKHIYPGFIAPNSTIGLMEIEAVRATRDYREVGEFTPNVRSVIAYNTDSEITPTVRSNGVLMAQVTPRGGTISGSSSVVHFDAWNWEDAIVQEVDGIHLNWPRMYSRSRKPSEKPGFTKNENYDPELRRINDYFSRAKAYAMVKNHKFTDLKMEAMRGLFDGSIALYVHAHDVKQISEAVAFKREAGIKRMHIIGGYDAWIVADLLRDNEVGVMLKRLHELPVYEDDDVDLPYQLPKLLQDEGVLFCFENAGGMAEMNTRNLQFYAGTAIAYGLTYEQAVMALTLNTAKILGVDDKVGSLEPGKQATLFVSEGDALDMRTNELSLAFIEGRKIDLDNKQKQLYRKYKAKYSGNSK